MSTQTDRIAGLNGGLALKAPVHFATTGPITLSGLQTVDGVSATAGMRGLVKDQANPIENGIYDVSATSWRRSKDFDGARDVVKGTTVRVVSGTVNAGRSYAITTADPILPGTSAIAWAAVAFGSIVEDQVVVATVAALKLLSSVSGSVAQVLDYATAGAGGGGLYRLDAADTTTADETFDSDGRWTVVDAAGTRWKLSFPDGIMMNQIGIDITGATDQKALIQKAFTAAAAGPVRKVVFPDEGTVLMESGASVSADDLTIDFGGTRIECDFASGGAAMVFGSQSDTPTRTGLHIRGGVFAPGDAATTQNITFITIRGTKKFSIRDVRMENVGNGGISVQAGCEDGDIDGNTILGKSGYSTCRAIWLNGSTASDWAAQLIDTNSLTRNATAVPTYAAKDIRVTNNRIIVPNYGVYLMNTRDCKIHGNHIDISGTGATRCIAVNNYSPGTIITDNTCISDRSSTGVLVTQYSHGVIIAENVFQGDFGGNRAVFISYLASALIQGNVFEAAGTQSVQFANGGHGAVWSNRFHYRAYAAGTRCIYITMIEPADAATLVGSTATSVPGISIKGNSVRNRIILAFTQQYAASNANVPGIDIVNLRDNELANIDIESSLASSDYLCLITSLSSSNKINVMCHNNDGFPAALARRSGFVDSGGYANIIRSDWQAAVIRIAVASGVVTVTKRYGGNFSCSTGLTGNVLNLSPRTIGGASGSAVAEIVAVTPVSTNVFKYELSAPSAGVRDLELQDTSGATITLSTIDATVDVTLSGFFT